MMQQHLKTPEEWERYLRLLARFDGREAELNARAALLAQQGLERGLPREAAVQYALDEAERVQMALRAQEAAAETQVVKIPPQAPRPWRSAAALGLALAAGLLIGVRVPREHETPDTAEFTWRGHTTEDAGELALWGDGLAGEPVRLSVNAVEVPQLRYRPEKPLRLMWIRPSGDQRWKAVAYQSNTSGTPASLTGDQWPFTDVDEPVDFTFASGATALVVVVCPLVPETLPTPAQVGPPRPDPRDCGVAYSKLVFPLLEVQP